MGLLEQRATAPLIWAVAMGYGITVGDRLLSLPDKQPPAKLRHMEGAWNTHSPGGRGSERAGGRTAAAAAAAEPAPCARRRFRVRHLQLRGKMSSMWGWKQGGGWKKKKWIEALR